MNSQPKQLCEAQRWQQYEQKKSAWLREHPSSTPQQYQQAIKAIADQLSL